MIYLISYSFISAIDLNERAEVSHIVWLLWDLQKNTKRDNSEINTENGMYMLCADIAENRKNMGQYLWLKDRSENHTHPMSVGLNSFL